MSARMRAHTIASKIANALDLMGAPIEIVERYAGVERFYRVNTFQNFYCMQLKLGHIYIASLVKYL